MPTSVPNFNFLAALVSKIRRGFPNKKMGAADLFKRPLTDIFLYRAPVLKMPTSLPDFHFQTGLLSEIRRGCCKKKWGLLISSDAA